jgi:hypothetical protein
MHLHPLVQGNIVLTNSNYEVLTLLRSHRDDDKGFAVMVRVCVWVCVYVYLCVEVYLC